MSHLLTGAGLFSLFKNSEIYSQHVMQTSSHERLDVAVFEILLDAFVFKDPLSHAHYTNEWIGHLRVDTVKDPTAQMAHEEGNFNISNCHLSTKI